MWREKVRGLGCSISKGVRNPNPWPAAVNNALVPQIPLLTSHKTEIVLKEFLIHDTGAEIPSEAS